MGLSLTVKGLFEDAEHEAPFVEEVVALVKKYAKQLTSANLSTDHSGAPEMPVGEPIPALTISGSLTPATVGAPFHASLTANGGTPPYVWLADGLVDGLNIDSATGAITGTPNVGGPAIIHVAIHDSATPQPETASEDFSIIVAGPISDEDCTQDQEIADLKAQLATIQAQLATANDPANANASNSGDGITTAATDPANVADPSAPTS